MTLPVLPQGDTILVNSATVLRDVVLPTIDDEWGRSCTRIIAAALDYAVGLLADDRDTRHRAELEAARALVWSREHDGADADLVRAVLHPVLVAHLDEEAQAASGVLDALHVAMRGTDSK